MISGIDSLYSRIDQGKDGLNKGLFSGFPIMDKFTYGIQRGCMTTVFADSSGGKTSYVIYSSVYQPLKHAIENNLTNINVLYFSLEISNDILMAKLLSLHIFDEYGIVVSYKDILSLESPVNDFKYSLIQKSRTWMERADQILTIFDKSVTSDHVDKIIRSWLGMRGKFIENDHSLKYIPDDSESYNIVIIDHIKLLTAVVSVKDEIDKCCKILIKYRNVANITIFVVQQANRTFKSMDRRNSVNKYLELQDMSDSSAPAQDSEVVIAINYPYREKMSTCEGFDIKKMKGRFRYVSILKNRYGESDRSIGMLFLGEIGVFQEIKTPIKGAVYDYDSVMSMNGYFDPESTKIKEHDENRYKASIDNLNLKPIDDYDSSLDVFLDSEDEDDDEDELDNIDLSSDSEDEDSSQVFGGIALFI